MLGNQSPQGRETQEDSSRCCPDTPDSLGGQRRSSNDETPDLSRPWLLSEPRRSTVFPEMAFQSAPALLAALPRLPPQDVPKKPCEWLRSHGVPPRGGAREGQKDKWGLSLSLVSLPARWGQSDPLSQSYLAPNSLPLFPLLWVNGSISTINEVQGTAPSVLGPQLYTPLQQAE